MASCRGNASKTARAQTLARATGVLRTSSCGVLMKSVAKKSRIGEGQDAA